MPEQEASVRAVATVAAGGNVASCGLAFTPVNSLTTTYWFSMNILPGACSDNAAKFDPSVYLGVKVLKNSAQVGFDFKDI